MEHEPRHGRRSRARRARRCSSPAPRRRRSSRRHPRGGVDRDGHDQRPPGPHRDRCGARARRRHRTRPLPRRDPANVEVGGTATATPHATDASSGVASQSCDVPQTSAAGAASVTCRATDVAGNTAVALAHYTVVRRVGRPRSYPDAHAAPTPPAERLAGTGRRLRLRPSAAADRRRLETRSRAPGGLDLPDRQALGPVAADGSSVYSRGSAVPVIFRALDDDGDAIGTRTT